MHRFIDKQLATRDCHIINLSKELVERRIEDMIGFVNAIREEYYLEYGWEPEPREYFLKDLKDKWIYSYCITDHNNDLYLVNFSSVYKDVIHMHCTYTHKSKRGVGLAKIHMLKLCQTALDNGFKQIEGYFPKNNNGSIALHLKMGWQIQEIEDNKKIIMSADINSVRDKTYTLLKSLNMNFQSNNRS